MMIFPKTLNQRTLCGSNNADADKKEQHNHNDDDGGKIFHTDEVKTFNSPG